MLALDTVHNTDLLTLCGMCDPQSIDMILCDLPYGTTDCSWDEIIPFEPMWAAFRRVIKPRGAIVLTASQPFTSKLVMSNLAWFKYEWIWEKSMATDFLNGKNKPMKAHENVMVFSSGTTANGSPNKMSYYPEIDKSKGAWKRVNRSDPRTGAWDIGGRTPFVVGELRGHEGRYPRSVVLFENGNHNNAHPTQKPVALFEYLIRTYTREGETVLDPCVGSGTTAIAARNTDRRYIVGDTSAEYIAITQKRLKDTDPYQHRELKNGIVQMSMFA